MKTIIRILIIIGIAVIISACHQAGGNITGVYVMSFKNEYSIATDTMIISAYSLEAGSYQIERKDGYHRIRQGKTLPKEYRQEHWMATFDKSHQLLSEGPYGRQVFIKGDGKTLTYNGTYQKIN
jgi:hypothetical protein